MLTDRTILVTGVTGQVARPLATALARDNTVFGAARFRDEAAREELAAAGMTCVPANLVAGDLSALPERVEHVLHLGVVKSGRWNTDLDGNVGGTLLLMERYASARSFLHCSSGAVYATDPDQALAEDHPLGDSHGVLPFLRTYSISKIAAEGAARHGARRFGLPTTIARLNVPYGPYGGLPAYHLDMMAAGMPISVHPDGPSRYQLIHDDDVLATVPGLLAAAATPATVVNWAGEVAVSVEEWCAELTKLTGVEATFAYSTDNLQSVVMDLTRLHELCEPTSTDWRDGLRRAVQGRRPDLLRPDLVV